MWVSTLPWGVIGQGALSETIGSLVATGLVTGGGWLIRRAHRRRKGKAVEHTADRQPPRSEDDSRIDA